MADEVKTDVVCCKAFEPEFKCGGCNYHSTEAWYMGEWGEPERDPDDEERLTVGMCPTCFCELLNGRKVVVE